MAIMTMDKYKYVACFLTLLFTASGIVEAQSAPSDCNICGEGNSIQFSTGVVQFVYEGEPLKNNCQRWQQVVVNTNAISDEFCRNEILQYTALPCRCTTPTGLQVEYIPPTVSPAPTQVQGTVSLGERDAAVDTMAPTPTPTPTSVPLSNDGIGGSGSTGETDTNIDGSDTNGAADANDAANTDRCLEDSNSTSTPRCNGALNFDNNDTDITADDTSAAVESQRLNFSLLVVFASLSVVFMNV